MVITCEKCNTSFNFDDTSLTQTGTKVRCSVCKNIWFVSLPVPEQNDKEDSELKLDLEPEVEIEFDIEPEPNIEINSEAIVVDTVDSKDDETISKFDPDKIVPPDIFNNETVEENIELDFADIDKIVESNSEQIDKDVSLISLDNGTIDIEISEFDISNSDNQIENSQIESSQIESSQIESSQIESSQIENSQTEENEKKTIDLDFQPLSDFNENKNIPDNNRSANSVNNEDGLKDNKTNPTNELEPKIDLQADSQIDSIIEVDSDLSMPIDIQPEILIDTPLTETLLEDSSPIEMAQIKSDKESEKIDNDIESQHDLPDKSKIDAKKLEQDLIGHNIALKPYVNKHSKISRRKKRKTTSSFMILFVILIVLLAGLYGASKFMDIKILGFDFSKVNVSYISDFLKNKIVGGNDYNVIPIKNTIDGKFVNNAKAGSLFVITGIVKNDSSKTVYHIEVKGSLLSKNDKPVEKKVYCGNMIPEDELSNLDPAIISQQLLNMDGKNKSNLNVEAGKSIPFMIVFSNMPEHLQNFTVEVQNFKKRKK